MPHCTKVRQNLTAVAAGLPFSMQFLELSVDMMISLSAWYGNIVLLVINISAELKLTATTVAVILATSSMAKAFQHRPMNATALIQYL